MTESFRFRVEPAEEGERLDKLVARRVPGVGRREATRLFKAGSVSIGGRVAVKAWLARAGDEVVVEGLVVASPEPEPDAPLVVVHEAAHVVVVDKPAGQPTAPIRGERGTLAAALLARYPEMKGVGYRAREPGLLHRLDTWTSGLVVAARSAEAFERLREGLGAGKLRKRYLAIVEARGLPAEGLIDDPLEPHPRDARRVVVARLGTGGAQASTIWRRVRVEGPWALVEVEVSHAYRHQIRAHLAHLGHPIAGDALYGGPPVSSLGQRHALHASYVAWAGDGLVPRFEAAADLPAPLAALLDG